MADTLRPDFAFERLRQRIDDPYARSVVVIIVDNNGAVDTAARGVRNDHEFFQIVHHVASELSNDILPTLEPEKARPSGKVLYVPRLNGRH